MKNYEVKDVNPHHRAEIEQHFAAYDSDNHDSCQLCGGRSHGLPACGGCRRACEHHRVVAGWLRRANGARQAYRRCWDCGMMTGNNLGALAQGATIHNVCLRDSTSTQPCGRCKNTSGVEYHHWAPRNTFTDADDWPTAWLCPACHSEWHQTMDGYRWSARAASA